MGKNIEELIYEETEKRLNIMQSQDYQYPERIKKIDIIAILALVIVNIVLMMMFIFGVVS